MKLVTRLKSAFGLESRTNSLENPAVSLSNPGIFAWLNNSEPTTSGELINDQTALQIVAVYSCVRVIAESVASLPMKLYERTSTGKIEAVDSPLYAMLTVSPNPEMTSFTFWETFTGSLALTGNAYAFIERNGAGQPINLWPLNPRQTTPHRLPNGDLVYKTGDGMQNGQTRLIASADMLHCPLLSLDGLVGLSPIMQARQTLGLSRAVEKFGARFFGSGARPGGIVSTTADLGDEQQAIIRETWQSAQGGQNQGKTAFLYGDWKYQSIALSPEEGQFLQTQVHNREQVASLFRVPVHMLGDTSKLSNNTATQLNLIFVTDCLRAYLCRIESEILRKLLPPVAGRISPYFATFDVRERLRGDFQQTMAGLAAGRQWGFYSINDCKAELGENPIGPEGDVYLVPLNMGNANTLVNSAEAEPTETVNTLGSFRSAYLRLFRDAVGRLAARPADKRDLHSVRNIFEPLAASIAELGAEIAMRSTDAPEWQFEPARAITDYLTKLTERSASWKPEDLDAIAVQELQKLTKTLSLAAHRSIGEHIALKGLSHVS